MTEPCLPFAPTCPGLPPATGPLAQMLARVAPATRAQLSAQMHQRVVPAGGVLFDQGEPIDSVGQVLSGTLGLICRAAGGRGQIVGLLLPPDLCGHPFAARATHRLEALGPARLLCLPRAALADVLLTEPEAEQAMAAQLLHDLDRTREALHLIGARRVTQRVASFLLLLARRLEIAPEAAPLCLPLSRAHLALYLGTRPETLSRSLHELADAGVLRIEDPYHFRILSAKALAQAAGQPER